MSTKVEIDSKLAKDISKIAKEEDNSENKVLNDVLERGIKDLRKELFFKKLESRGGKIANKNTCDPYNKDFKSLCGIIDTPKEFDAVKAVEESRKQ